MERRAAKAVWSDLEAFCRRVRSRLDEASFAERQRILQLLIERIIVGEDSLEIRHVIPLGQAGGGSSGSGPEGSPGSGDGERRGPEEEPGPRPICRLRSDGVTPADLSAGPVDPVIGAKAVSHRDRPLLRAQHGFGHLGVPLAGDREDRDQPGDRRPKPGLAPFLRQEVSSAWITSAVWTAVANSL